MTAYVFVSSLWSTVAFSNEPVIYLNPVESCSTAVLDNDNWNALYAAAIFAESGLWTRSGVPFRDHPKIDGNTIVDTISQLRSLCRKNSSQNVSQLIEGFVALWRESSATAPVSNELGSCSAKGQWHKRGPALALPQETNLYLTHRDSGERAEGNVHVFYEPRARCSLLLFSGRASGWPFTADLYALGAAAVRQGKIPALSTVISGSTIEPDHNWNAQCRLNESSPFEKILALSVPAATMPGFKNGRTEYPEAASRLTGSDYPFDENGEDTEPMV
ncbi:MAG: hypothetical protein AB8B94_13645 [Hyphomicrobiales bacterium]